MAGRDDFVDKGRPVVGPFLLEDGDENKIKLVEKGFVGSQGLVGVGGLDNELDNKVADA